MSDLEKIKKINVTIPEEVYNKLKKRGFSDEDITSITQEILYKSIISLLDYLD